MSFIRVVELFIGTQFYHWLNHWRKCLFLTQEPLVSYKSSGKWWTHEFFPSKVGCFQAQSYTDLIQDTHSRWMLWVLVCNRTLSYPQLSILYHSPTTSGSYGLSTSYSLSLGGGDTDVPCMAEHSTVIYSHHFDQLWVSEVTAVHSKRMLPWPQQH